MLAAAGMMQVILSHLALCFSLNTQRQSQSEPIHLSIHHRKAVNTINLGFAPFLLALFKVIPFLSHPSFVGACPWSTCIWKFSFLRRKNKDRSGFFFLWLAQGPAWVRCLVSMSPCPAHGEKSVCDFSHLQHKHWEIPVSVNPPHQHHTQHSDHSQEEQLHWKREIID